MEDDGPALDVVIVAPDGRRISLANGDCVRFGRNTACEVVIPRPDVSRLAGEIAWTSDGVRIANRSRSHSLYIEAEEGRTKLARADTTGPPCGFLLRAGTALIGSWAMFQDRQVLQVIVPSPHGVNAPEDEVTGETTIRHRLILNTRTKEFLVALLLCRPWLLDPSRATPIPKGPELARQALEVTNSWHLLSSAASRERVTNRIHEYLKNLRDKLVIAGLAEKPLSPSPPTIASLLLAHDVITHAHLDLLKSPEWVRHQENLWWDEPEER